MKRNSYAVILGNLGNTCDRFLPTGYKERKTTQEMIRQAGGIEGITGLELVGNWDVTQQNVAELRRWMTDAGLACVSIIPDLFSRSIWGNGSFSARDSSVRRRALDETRAAVDIALQMKCPLLNLWLGQDGYDYVLQADFERQRTWLMEGIAAVAGEFPEIKLAIEYKLKEPRTHSFHARAADTLLMVREMGHANVGVCIDVGHAFLAQENAAESAWLLQHYGRKLFHMHFNDNYRYCDDDMIVGSVHFVEYVELLYWLREMGYDGWYSIDLYPYREDGVRAVSESVQFLRQLEDAITTSRMQEMRELVLAGDATAATRWVRKLIFQR